MGVQVDSARTRRFTVGSSDGSTVLAARLWLPPEGVEVKRTVQLVHGMAEHIGRYDAFARHLASRGAIVVGHDHAGHGASARAGCEPEVSWGELEPDAGAEQLVEDVELVFEAAPAETAGLPRVLFGHSMGSFVARVYSAVHGSGLSAAVFCGTGWQRRAELSAGLAITSVVGRLRGWSSRSGLVNGMAVGAYGKGFLSEQYPSIAWLSRVVEVRQDYDSDPACGFMFTVGAYHELFRLIEKSQDPSVVSGMPHDLPVLFTSGTADPVGGERAVASAAAFLRECGVLDVTQKLYPDARHEILNETNAGEVMDDIATWIERKAAL